jgi:hypothetical protein
MTSLTMTFRMDAARQPLAALAIASRLAAKPYSNHCQPHSFVSCKPSSAPDERLFTRCLSCVTSASTVGA